MANILYITPDFYIKNKLAGGMGTKTHAIQEAWGSQHYIEAHSTMPKDTADLWDYILIELLGFRNDDKFDERLKALKACEAPKLVYGSDSEIFRWSGKEIDKLKSVVSLWIPNCPWQADYFNDFDLPVTPVVFEPINADIFRPGGVREKVVVAGGNICTEKNIPFFIELFTKIRELNTEYKTAYLGSPAVWKELTAVNMQLDKRLRNATDYYHGKVTQPKVATALGEAAVAVLNPIYETCNRFHMELMLAATPTLCGKHICFDERPVSGRFTTVQECIDLLAEFTNNWTEVPDKVFGEAEQKFATEHFSYEASLNQLSEVFRLL